MQEDEDDEDDEDNDDDDSYELESVSELDDEELEQDEFGVWGEKHPQFGKKMHCNSRVFFSSDETDYIISFMRQDPSAGARACLHQIRNCPRARKIFHFHHVQYPGRIDSKFKELKRNQ